ncbi:MAG: hypothetical protein AB4426_09135, partial [Xenococcaceae cyanobacterium]
PTLTAEIKEALLPQNRYPDVVKRDKVPYQGSFEEIAAHAVKNDIGKIANQIMTAVTLRWETVLMPEEKKEGYLQQVAKYYRAILAKDAEARRQVAEGRIPPRYRTQIEAIANLPQKLSSQQIETALQQMRDVQFRIVGDLSNELQVAVDGPKSALRPDANVLSACKEIGGYQPVTWLGARDKSRNPQVYRTKPYESNNYGPVDRMIQVANEKWQQSPLIARPAVQFRGFFSEANHPQMAEIAQEIKETYNDYLKRARSLSELKNENPELIDPYIEVTSTKSHRTIYLTRLERFVALESGFFSKDKPFPIDLRLANNTFNREIPNSLVAVATIERDGKTIEKPIAAVAIASTEQHNLKTGLKLTQGMAAIQPGITSERIDGIYRSLDEYVDMVRQEHPESERRALAAALWYSTHTRDEYQTKKALLAFKLFPNEAVKQLEELQFTQLKVVGLHFRTNEYGNRQWRGEEVNCAIALHPIPDKAGKLEHKRVIEVEGKVLAPLTSESPALPVGTKFRAEIVAEPSSAVVATTPKGNSLKIRQVKNFAYGEREWQGEEQPLTVALVKNSRGREVPLVTVEENALGVLDRESEVKLRERNLLNGKGFTLVSRLENSPPTTAQVCVKPETVLYPWQQKEQERQLEVKRAVYRERYEVYAAQVLNNSAITCAASQEVDVEVAILAYAQTNNPHEVAIILSQSDQVREWRASVPDSRSWNEYVKQAQDYIRYVQADAHKRWRQISPERQLEEELSH